MAFTSSHVSGSLYEVRFLGFISPDGNPQDPKCRRIRFSLRCTRWGYAEHGRYVAWTSGCTTNGYNHEFDDPPKVISSALERAIWEAIQEAAGS